MTISVRDARSARDDRHYIAGAYRDYLEDLFPLNTGVFPALAEFGHREPDQVDQWFQDRRATLLTILKDVRPVGFALVATGAVAGARPSDYRMTEFFISRPERRRGVGLSAVRLIFDRFNGRWEVTEYQRNPAAVQFWRRAIGLYTGGRYEERVQNGEVRQHFRSRDPRTVADAPTPAR